MLGNLDKLSSEWETIDEILIYGTGRVAELCFDAVEKSGLHISGMIDTDEKKQGGTWHGRRIYSYDEASRFFPSRKIIVLTGHTAYNEICVFLERQGLDEYKDFCRGGQFICEWMWKAKEMNCLYHVDITITTNCTLKCEHCNMFIPYYEKPFHYSFEEVRKEIDLLFERVDYIAYVGLIGGETLLSPVLVDLIRYLHSAHGDKYGKLFLTTNGTVIPSESFVRTINECGVHLAISDYTAAVPYKEKLEILCEFLDSRKADYEIIPVRIWCDYGFPKHPFKRNDTELEEHLAACKPEWNGLNDGRFYYCNCAWSAEKSGHFKLQKDDYIELSEIDPSDREACRKIVALSCGSSSFCSVCGGCGRDNTNFVTTGAQMKRNGEDAGYY